MTGRAASACCAPATGFAAHADEGWQGVGGQLAVYEGEGTALRDAGLAPLSEYYYTFFVRDGAGGWSELLRERVSTRGRGRAGRGQAAAW